MAKVFDRVKGFRGSLSDERDRKYLVARRVVMTQGNVRDAALLMNEKSNVPTLSPDPSPDEFAVVRSAAQQSSECACIMKNSPDTPHAAILLDFGVEIAGSVRIMSWKAACGEKKSARAIVRFGESVMEALTPVGVKGACNDHALRDVEMEIPSLGSVQTGESGYRFVYIELLGDDAELELKSVQGVFTFLDLDYVGSFECDNERLNRVWNTAAYTAHLNMQEYLLDGIKRDRLVWMGDMYTHVNAIMAVFGNHPIIARSLDLMRDRTPFGEWMNGISSYSIWWILVHHELYRHFGNRTYLGEQRTYMRSLLERLMTYVGEEGEEKLDGWRFLDWKTSENDEAVHAGLQALMVMALEQGAELMSVLEEDDVSAKCRVCAEKLKLHKPAHANSKAAAALLSLSGLGEKEEMSEFIRLGGARGFSAFLSYHIFSALAEAGNINEAMDMACAYFGGMLDLGATTFWEDFDIDWARNAGRIDEIVPNGKDDVHGDFGSYCYEGFRHSLCHAWSSGVCAFMSRYILGIEVLSPKVVRISPNLGKLRYVQGTYPTPYGELRVAHTRRDDGTVSTQIVAPSQLKVLRAPLDSPDGKVNGKTVGY